MTRALQGHKGAVFTVDMDDTTNTIYSGANDHVSRCMTTVDLILQSWVSIGVKVIRVWDSGCGLCMRMVKVNTLLPVMALHWNKVSKVGREGYERVGKRGD